MPVAHCKEINCLLVIASSVFQNSRDCQKVVCFASCYFVFCKLKATALNIMNEAEDITYEFITIVTIAFYLFYYGYLTVLNPPM